MRYLSRIIKSAQVSLVKEIDVDNPVVVKTDEIIAKLEQEAVIREAKEKKEVKSQDCINTFGIMKTDSSNQVLDFAHQSHLHQSS